MLKYFDIESGFDFSILLAINPDVLTEGMVTEMNNFWGNSDRMMRASNGDVYQAFARRAALQLFVSLFEGYDAEQAVQLLSQQEGWYPQVSSIQIVDATIPRLDAEDFVCTEV
jgi:hypothetical protein